MKRRVILHKHSPLGENPQQHQQQDTILTGGKTITTNFNEQTFSSSQHPYTCYYYNSDNFNNNTTDKIHDNVLKETTGLETEALRAFKEVDELNNGKSAAVASIVLTTTNLSLSESSAVEEFDNRGYDRKSHRNTNNNMNNLKINNNNETNDEFWWRNEALINNNGTNPTRYATARNKTHATKNKTNIHIYKKHMISDAIDVLIRIGIVILFSKLEVSNSFKRYIQMEELWLYKFPRTDDYVGTSMLLLTVIGIPFVVTVLQFWWSSDVRDFRAANWVWTGALCLNGITTSLLKICVGRPRPDFFYRCYPNGQMPLNATLERTNILDISTCTGDWRLINEGFKSFPSGHASFAFVGYGFVTFYMGAKLHAFSTRGRGETWRLYLALIPLMAAILVAVSRTCDYHHHWQDVVVGSIMGFFICYYTYRQYYPSVFADDCHKALSRSSRRFSATYKGSILNRKHEAANKPSSSSVFDMNGKLLTNSAYNDNDEDDESIFEANAQGIVKDNESRPLMCEKVDANNKKLTARNKII